METAVYFGASFLGYLEEDACRNILRDGQGRLVRGRNGSSERRILLNGAPTVRVREMCSGGSATPAIGSVQTEELYQGIRHPRRGEERTCGPVTARLAVLRKYVPGIGFKDWGERERFPRHRFNPDSIRPLFRSLADYQQRQAA